MIESCFVCLFGKPNIDIWCRYRITVSHAVSLLVCGEKLRKLFAESADPRHCPGRPAGASTLVLRWLGRVPRPGTETLSRNIDTSLYLTPINTTSRTSIHYLMCIRFVAQDEHKIN